MKWDTQFELRNNIKFAEVFWANKKAVEVEISPNVSPWTVNDLFETYSITFDIKK